MQSNPATEIIDQAISSIREQPSLVGVPMTIICDGAKVTEDPVSKFKSGIISEEAQLKYEVYKQKLRLKYGSEPSITIVERS